MVEVLVRNRFSVLIQLSQAGPPGQIGTPRFSFLSQLGFLLGTSRRIHPEAFDIVKRVAQLEFHHFAAISNPFLFVRTGFPETVQFLVETDDELSPLAAKFNALRITGIPEFTA